MDPESLGRSLKTPSGSLNGKKSLNQIGLKGHILHLQVIVSHHMA